MDSLQLRLLNLSQASLNGGQIDFTLFEEMMLNDWETLLKYAIQQGVSAIVFPAFEFLKIKPPLRTLLKWFGQVEFIKSNYMIHERGCQQMVALCKDAGANMFVIKGLSLADFYPNPASREFGDLDIFTFNTNGSAHESVNRLVEKKGIKVKCWDKHDVFNYRGVHIEHHSYFVSNKSKSGRRINDYLIRMVLDGNYMNVKDNLYFPSPDFNAIYLMIHTIEHMSYEGIILKNVLDYGVFLMRDGNKVNWKKVNAILKETGWNVGYDTLVRVVEKVLNVDFSHFYIDCPNELLVNKMFSVMLDSTLHKDTKFPLMKRILKKTQRAFSHKWLYDNGVIPANFWNEFILTSVKGHIIHPSQL